ncbi:MULTISPECIES: hypothetical protein [Xanthomonas]|uniref:Uncharacterized protein n=1 Tax=Xanthomonas cucurbitae TaxID=56453 RepID=A0A2S7DQK2_9XANT|nr:hypothetical protein [Xanthomonas cucurbitae]PPU76113.1 hypothetical protein XcuCFBP2542_11480 [Xanthomonas cucurbitae]QHG87479.1 hypothetical protein EBN15_11555 [Xanthomonas cucurbitae]WDM69385.1 hypothetical protein K6981_09235 [Xanthomonas cucurbitae]WDM73258.1 hypothetical protein K6978_09205 [Xanthomonas cucurbitae]WDM74088.1 hypothetical protein K6982_11620 [Xanthomonas cucurbitae]
MACTPALATALPDRTSLAPAGVAGLGHPVTVHLGPWRIARQGEHAFLFRLSALATVTKISPGSACDSALACSSATHDKALAWNFTRVHVLS